MNRENAHKLVRDARRVSVHAFFPFIEFNIVTRRYRSKKEKEKVNGKTVKRRHLVEPKVRPIKLSSHKDGYIYSYYAKLLSNAYEKFVKENKFGQSVIAYRPRMGTNFSNAIEAFDAISGLGPCVIYTVDISSFFENIDHAILKKNWCRLFGWDKLPRDHYKIFKSLTKYSKIRMEDICRILNLTHESIVSGGVDIICTPDVFRDRIRGASPSIIQTNRNGYGIPQGSAMSAVLSNVYMIDFDTEMEEFADNNGIFYRRYCDDIILVKRSHVAIDVLDFMKDVLSRTGVELKIHEEKTEKYIFDGEKISVGGAVQYLGLTFDGKKILIRNGSLAKFHRKMRSAVSYRKFKARKRKGDLNGVLMLRTLYRKYSWKKDFKSFHGYAGRVGAATALSGVKGQLRKNQCQLERLLKD